MAFESHHNEEDKVEEKLQSMGEEKRTRFLRVLKHLKVT